MATSTDRQFAGRPPGAHWELSFSVRSQLSGLEVQLSSTAQLGGFLLHVGADGRWVRRTVVGTAAGEPLLTKPVPPPDQEDQATAADRWSSYAVTVSQSDTLRLERLYDNGTRRQWLELQHPGVSSMDLASVRVTPPLSERGIPGLSSGSGPEASGHWGFWKFDCSKYYYQTGTVKAIGAWHLTVLF